MKKHRLCILAIFVCCIYASCTNSMHTIQEKNGEIRLMTYNTQTFFDAVDTGREFAEFRGGKTRWNAERYEQRLTRLCEVLETGKADIVILQEIENEAVLYDIANRMTRFTYGVFLGNSTADVFANAVLSRFPIREVRNHEVTLGGSGEPSMRPISQVHIEMPNHILALFVCHWKSKSGGEEQSVIWRTAQENTLSSALAAAESTYSNTGIQKQICIAAGDFNQTIYEFKTGFIGTSAVYNPWVIWLENAQKQSENGSETPLPSGSYFYKDTWETIDHFFILQKNIDNDSIHLRDFFVYTDANHVDTQKKPQRYDVFSAKGYSDHLPLILIYRVDS